MEWLGSAFYMSDVTSKPIGNSNSAYNFEIDCVFGTASMLLDASLNPWSPKGLSNIQPYLSTPFGVQTLAATCGRIAQKCNDASLSSYRLGRWSMLLIPESTKAQWSGQSANFSLPHLSMITGGKSDHWTSVDRDFYRVQVQQEMNVIELLVLQAVDWRVHALQSPFHLTPTVMAAITVPLPCDCTHGGPHKLQASLRYLLHCATILGAHDLEMVDVLGGATLLALFSSGEAGGGQREGLGLHWASSALANLFSTLSGEGYMSGSGRLIGDSTIRGAILCLSGLDADSSEGGLWVGGGSSSAFGCDPVTLGRLRKLRGLIR